MEVLDPGHKYKLQSYDGDEEVILTFVKRNEPQEKYPGNKDAYSGTIIQEVLRSLIDRLEHVNKQKYDWENFSVKNHLELAFLGLENRTRKQRGQPDIRRWMYGNLLEEKPCAVCGHILCLDHKEKDEEWFL